MDRNLQIVVVSAGLAIVCGYVLRACLRDGSVLVIRKRIAQKENPGGYWTVMILLGLVEATFVGLAVAYSVAWLRLSP